MAIGKMRSRASGEVRVQRELIPTGWELSSERGEGKKGAAT